MKTNRNGRSKPDSNGHDPETGQFLPGNSGGPGRPKDDAYAQLRDEIRAHVHEGKESRLFIVGQLFDNAAKGGKESNAALKLLLEYGWGKSRPHDDELDAMKATKRWSYDFLERGYIDREQRRNSRN